MQTANKKKKIIGVKKRTADSKQVISDIDKINQYTRRPLTEEQVYIFNVTLCDNEIDRDFERFTKKALDELQPLFEGKTGIFDHSVSSSKQTARIFKTWVETDKMCKTSLGEPYSCLRARAYMVRTKNNEAMIAEIEGGIKRRSASAVRYKRLLVQFAAGIWELMPASISKVKHMIQSFASESLNSRTTFMNGRLWLFLITNEMRLIGLMSATDFPILKENT